MANGQQASLPRSLCKIKSLEAAISNDRKQARAVADPVERRALLDQLHRSEQVIRGLGPGGDLRRLCSPRTPALLKLLLGTKTNVVTLRKDQSLGIKEEYHQFRDRAVYPMLLVPLALYLGMKRADHISPNESSYTLTPPLMTGMQIYVAGLAYFYIALALRENVLQVNGSTIRSWWVHHHYWSAMASLLMLALPVSSPTVYYFCEHFLLWSCFQAVVMFVQNRYQRRRMYTRIALGKNSAMDVVAGESSGGSGQLLLLYPLLFGLQLWQFAIGAEVAYKTLPGMLNKEGWLDNEASESDLRGMRSTFVSGIIFAGLALTNFINTVATILEKKRYRSSMRRVGSKSSNTKPL